MPDGPVHAELFGGAGGTAHGIARALAPAGITVWSVDNAPERHARNPYAWFTGDWREGLDRALDTGRVVSIGAAPPCTKNSAGTRAVDRSRYNNDPDLENVREVLIETGLPYFIENVESEVTKRKMRSPLRLCGSEFDLQADDPSTGLRLWLRRHRFFESNVPLMGNGGCRHPKGLRCAGVYGGARRNEAEARLIRKGGYVPKDIEVLRQLLGAPEWIEDRRGSVSFRAASDGGVRRRATARRDRRTGGGVTEWMHRVWRDVAKDYCEHLRGPHSCMSCRLTVSEITDVFTERWQQEHGLADACSAHNGEAASVVTDRLESGAALVGGRQGAHGRSAPASRLPSAWSTSGRQCAVRSSGTSTRSR